MIVRKLDSNGDMSFGHNANDFYSDTPEGVAQCVGTRLKLYAGEWYLDNRIGTRYAQSILGYNSALTRDAEIRRVITETEGVKSILDFTSDFDGETRRVKFSCTINTIYGEATVSEVF